MSEAAYKIQLPYYNRFRTIWEYEEAFISGQIDFVSFIGVCCPICGGRGCYRQITPYWRYAIELFPRFEKRRIPVARFLCRRTRRTFSLLPIQLIPYFRYTVGAVIGSLLLGVGYWQRGQRGFYGASLEVDPDSLVTPWLISCWLMVVVVGFWRGHVVLREFYNLDGIRSSGQWEGARAYFSAFGLRLKTNWYLVLLNLLYCYSRETGQFLFGIPSQYRPFLHL